MATLRLPEIVRSAAGGEGLSRFHIGDLRAGQGVAADRGNAVFSNQPLWMRQSVRDSTGQSLPAIVWDVRL